MSEAEAELRRQLMELLQGRIARIREVIRVYDTGGISESRALSHIEEIASGDGDRIVAPGRTHTPEVQS